MNPYSKQFDLRKRHQRHFVSYKMQIRNAISTQYEGRNLDFKLADAYQTKGKNGSQKRNELLRDIASMANANGGRIILGVKENKHPPHKIHGIHPDEIDAIRNRLYSWASRYLLPDSRFVNFKDIELDNKQLLVIEIEQCRSGPAYYEQDGGHLIPMREHEENRPARVEEINRLFRGRPLSVARQEAQRLATEFYKLLLEGGDVYGALISNMSDSWTDQDHLFQSMFSKPLVRDGFRVFEIATPEIRDFSLNFQDQERWVLGSCVLLNEALEPVGIKTTGYTATITTWCDKHGRSNAYWKLAEQAGQLVTQHGQDLFGTSGFWSGIDAAAIKISSEAWPIVLAHWQLENSPQYFFKSMASGGSMRSVMQDITDVNEKGYIDPVANSFIVPFTDDLRALSWRILHHIST